jgi:hypothetical protein
MMNILSKAIVATLTLSTTMSALASCGGMPSLGAASGSATVSPKSLGGVKVVYSNFGKGDMAYDSASGYSVSGAAYEMGGYNAIALTFTPEVDVAIGKVQVPLTYSGVMQNFKLSLNQDAAGVPGAAIKTKTNTDPLPTGGGCCSVITLNMGGVPVTAGRAYWLVIKPAVAKSNASANWHQNCIDTIGTVAMDNGNGWELMSNKILPAIYVSGN